MTVEEKEMALTKSEVYKYFGEVCEKLSSALRSENAQLYTPLVTELCAAIATDVALRNVIPHGNVIVNIIRRVGISVISTMVGTTADRMTRRIMREMIIIYDRMAEKFMKLSKELEDSANEYARTTTELQISQTRLLN